MTDFLDSVCQDLAAEFEANRRVLSFRDYMELFESHPEQQARTAPQYLLDCFDHYGSEIRPFPGTEGAGGDKVDGERHWKLFDIPWDQGRDRVIGHEAAQDAIYRIIQGFSVQRRV